MWRYCIISWDDLTLGKSSHRIIASWDDILSSQEMMKYEPICDDIVSPNVMMSNRHTRSPSHGTMSNRHMGRMQISSHGMMLYRHKKRYKYIPWDGQPSMVFEMIIYRLRKRLQIVTRDVYNIISRDYKITSREMKNINPWESPHEML